MINPNETLFPGRTANGYVRLYSYCILNSSNPYISSYYPNNLFEYDVESLKHFINSPDSNWNYFLEAVYAYRVNRMPVGSKEQIIEISKSIFSQIDEPGFIDPLNKSKLIQEDIIQYVNEEPISEADKPSYYGESIFDII